MNAWVTAWRKAVRIGVCGCAAVPPLCFAAAPPRPQEAAATNRTAAAQAALRLAAEADRDGRTEAAIAAYESSLKNDTAIESVVAPRLVTLYTRCGEAGPALAWAVRVASRHPAPAAYLAGVHERLGQFKEAELALRTAVQDEKDAGKRTPLLWQLADVQERQGASDDALATLAQARDGAADEPQRQTTARRLDALRQRLKGTERKRAAIPEEGCKGDGTP